MILEKVTGCTCSSLTVDGVEEIELCDNARVATLKKISEYFRKMELSKFREVIDDELLMYTTEEDLEYVDGFYSTLLVNKTIKPLQQISGMNALDEEYLLVELRAALANFILNMSTDDLNWLLQQVTESLGEPKYLGYCEQCCDSIDQYTLKI